MDDDGELWAVTPRAVVFDVDGLLVDTEPCWTVAETELFARRGLPFGDEQKALLIGRGLREACDGLSRDGSRSGCAPTTSRPPSPTP